MFSSRSKQRGITFIEAALVMGAIALLTRWDQFFPAEEAQPQQQSVIEGGFVTQTAEASRDGQPLFRYKVSRKFGDSEPQPEVGRTMSFVVEPSDRFVAIPVQAQTDENGLVSVTISAREPGQGGRGVLIVTDQSGAQEQPVEFVISEG